MLAKIVLMPTKLKYPQISAPVALKSTRQVIVGDLRDRDKCSRG
jgi:hypothetical protein